MFNLWVKKKELELEVKRLTDLLSLERTKLAGEFDILKKANDFELVKIRKALEMDYNDKLQKQSALYEKALRSIEAASLKEVSDLKSSLAKEYYDKMGEALTQLNIDGSMQSKFVQELSLKMFEKALEKPMPAHIINERHLIETKE